MANEQNLKPFTKENAKEMQLKGAGKRKENTEKRTVPVYFDSCVKDKTAAEFLEKEYNVKTTDGTKKISGSELVNEAMKKIMARGDSSTVSLMKELREGTEGSKINLSGSVTTEMQTTEERLKAFEELVK